MTRGGALLREHYHGAEWQEPIIMELGRPGERGVVPPAVEPELEAERTDALAAIPEGLRRDTLPGLPELSQPQVLRHYIRLTQETLGTDVNIDLGLGTCTMKYSPKINEVIARSPKVSALHPLQDEETLQGILEVVWRFSEILIEISGMDCFSFQPGGGAAAIFANASIIRAYHERQGEAEQRNEIITTAFSHPADAATPATAGFRVITLYPEENGYPGLGALRAALSDRTAGMMATNPEDTGIFNPLIREFTDAVHAAGGICSIDQANANGLLGIVRARDLGFDLCHFNLHKTFGSPHGSEGPGCGALGARADFRDFLPVPMVDFDGVKFRLEHDLPHSIGRVRSFLGNLQVVLRAYAWAMSLGPDGLRTVAETAVLNNNYLAHKLARIRGVTIPYAPGKYRLQEVRYSWEDLERVTGVTTDDIARRIVDYGVNNYFTSHSPMIVPQPFTLEPTESYSKDELDEYAEILERVSSEAYSTPDLVKGAPHRSSVAKIDDAVLHDPQQVVTTWRAWVRRGNG